MPFDSYQFNQSTFDGPQVYLVEASANLVCTSTLNAQPYVPHYVSGSADLVCSSILIATGTNVFYGGVTVGGTVPVKATYNEKGQGGVELGGSAGVTYIEHVPCYKPPLPLHPKPSTADYAPQNIAPLIEFFRPIVSGVLGHNVGVCNIEFRYENNTPCIYTDDIFVRYPTCIPVPYVPVPPPKTKSQAQIYYESKAKQSQRLYNYMIKSPARIKYFNSDVEHQILPY